MIFDRLLLDILSYQSCVFLMDPMHVLCVERTAVCIPGKRCALSNFPCVGRVWSVVQPNSYTPCKVLQQYTWRVRPTLEMAGEERNNVDDLRAQSQYNSTHIVAVAKRLCIIVSSLLPRDMRFSTLRELSSLPAFYGG